MPRQAQEQFVSGDQKIGMTACGEFEELLIVRVAATWQRGWRRVCIGVTKLHPLPVAIEQLALRFGQAF